MSIAKKKLSESSMHGQTDQSSYLQAISEALWEELERDKKIFLIGEDIGEYGGAFKVTDGFLAHFGEDRIIDAPLEETGFIGAAIGAALTGMRPVVEVQYADFISCGWDQIVNVAAKMHYRSLEAVPIVIRCPSGAGLRAGPFHSQSPEALFSHIPGLKVVAPGTPYDAKGLLKSAIRDDNPVLFFEHKYLYRRLKEELPVEDYTVPIGKAAIKRSGDDMTLVTYGAMLQKSLEAADRLIDKGISIEIIDLRTIYPLDTETIIESVNRTNKIMIVHEDTRTLGIGSEIAAVIADAGFQYLDGPIKRVTAPDVPIPFSPPLEDAFLPQVADIMNTAIDLFKY